MAGKMRLGMGAERLCFRRARRIVRHGVTHELPVAIAVHGGDNGALAHALGLCDDRLDVAQLDTEAAQLDLVVAAPQKLERAIGQASSHIARLVEPLRNAANRHIAESGMGLLGVLEIADGKAVAANVQFARHAHGRKPVARVQNVELRVGDGLADGDRCIRIVDPRDRGPDRGLGRPIHVPQFAAQRAQAARQPCGQRFAAAQHLERLSFAKPRFDKHLPERWRCLQNGCATLLETLDQPEPVLHFDPVGDHHAATADQRQVEFQRGDVEGNGGDGKQCVVHRKAGLLRHGGEEVDERVVRNLHALGHAGRAGSEDDVGRSPRAMNPFLERCRIPGGNRLPLVIEPDRQNVITGKGGNPVTLADHGGDFGCLHGLPQACLGMILVERHIDVVGLHDRQQRHQHVYRAVECHGDTAAGHEQLFLEQPCHLPASRIEFAIGDAFLAMSGGNGVGRFRRAVAKQLEGKALIIIGRLRLVELIGKPVHLVLRHERQAFDGRAHILRKSFDERGEMAEPAFDGLGIEHVAIVVDIDADAVLALDHVGEHVEIRKRLGVGDDIRGKPAKIHSLRHPLQVELDFRQGKAAWIALQTKLPHQRSIGEVLMLESLKNQLLRVLQMLCKGPFFIQRLPQGQKIDAMADQRFVIKQALPCRRHGDYDVVAARKPRDHHLHGCEQGGKQRRAVLRAGLLQPPVDIAVDIRGHGAAGKAALFWARSVGRHVRQVRHGLELREPESLRLFIVLRSARARLRIGGKSQCRRQVRCVALHKRAIGRRQFIDQDIRRPAVADDVMGREDKYVPLV